MIFTKPEQLSDALLDLLGTGTIIGIDAWIGSGKTTLAELLSATTGRNFYDIDCALNKYFKHYVPALRLDEIRQKIASEEFTFVSGICLRKVLELVGVKADAHIYIKRMATWGWADADELSGAIPELPGSSGEVLRRELRSYHQEFSPHLTATFEFHRLGR